MSGKQSSQKEKSSDMQKRSAGNLGQKEARLGKEKESELSHMGGQTRESKKIERHRDRSR
jgi:hypothetical protein